MNLVDVFLFNPAIPRVIVSMVPLHGSERHSFGLIMNKNSRVFHVRGFTSKLGAVLKAIREGNAVWVEEGALYREANLAEQQEAMNRLAVERMRAQEILEGEIPGLRFEKPRSTTYQPPWAAYEEIDSPMGVRYCRWPRRLQESA